MRNITVSRILRQVRFCCHIMFLHLWWWATVRLSPINKDSWNLMFYDPSCCSKRILILKHDLPNNSAVYDWWPQLHVKQQARAPCSLISLSCHSACCERSITEQWYHAIDSVSTIVGETASGAWSMVPPIHHSTIGWSYRAKPFPKWTKLPSVPPAFHWLCIGRMKYACIVYLRKKKIYFIHPSVDRLVQWDCRLRSSLLVTFPMSLQLHQLFYETHFGNSQSRFSFPANGSRSEIVCIRSTIWQWCDVSNKCFWSMPYNAWVSSICWVPSLLFNDCSVTGIFILGWFFLLVWWAAADPTAGSPSCAHVILCFLRLLCYCGALFYCCFCLMHVGLSGLSWPLGLSSLKVQDSIFLLMYDWEWLLVQTYCSHCFSLFSLFFTYITFLKCKNPNYLWQGITASKVNSNKTCLYAIVHTLKII